MRIVLDTDGNTTTIGTGKSSEITAGNSYQLGMRVYDAHVACSMAGQDVATAVIPSGGSRWGGLGFTSWDSILGNSEVQVQTLKVIPLAADDIQIPLPAPVSSIRSAPTSTVTTPSIPPPNLSLPYVENKFTGDPNWLRIWGAMLVDASGFMHIGATSSTTGGGALLDNTGSWSNYNAVATINWVKGQTFTLFARYVDSQNYVACEFSEEDPGIVTMQLKESVNSKQVVLQTGTASGFYNDGRSAVAVGIKVNDSEGSCSFGNHTISNSGGNFYTLPQFKGGIGLETWDPTVNNSEIILKSIDIEKNY